MQLTHIPTEAVHLPPRCFKVPALVAVPGFLQQLCTAAIPQMLLNGSNKSSRRPLINHVLLSFFPSAMLFVHIRRANELRKPFCIGKWAQLSGRRLFVEISAFVLSRWDENGIVFICQFYNGNNTREEMLSWWVQKKRCVGSGEVGAITGIGCSSRCCQLHKAAASVCADRKLFFFKIYLHICKCNKPAGICNKLRVAGESRHSSRGESVAGYVKWEVSKQVGQQLHSWALTSRCDRIGRRILSRII